jgi:uncharacterized membrane protein
MRVFGQDRLVFVSDADFAIAITLLALDIRLPVDAAALSDRQLFDSLVSIWPEYLSYFVSFLVIGNSWIAHHRRYRWIIRDDTRLSLINLFVLMSIAFIPFQTAVLSENGNRTATLSYSLSIALTGLLSALLWWYASRENRLLEEGFNARLARRNLISILTIPGVSVLSIGLAFVNAEILLENSRRLTARPRRLCPLAAKRAFQEPLRRPSTPGSRSQTIFPTESADLAKSSWILTEPAALMVR